MPLSTFLGGAFSVGTAQSLWSYNRENYMWDWQNRQARDFQHQNIAIGRYGLFREDIRDLAGLTTNRIDSYLVVNTLKLGFIVSLFFNYDKDDGPTPSHDGVNILTMLYAICFLTSFFFLLFSIWFSMHAAIIAQCFMTKVLLQVVRIPLPSDEEINQAAPDAQEYEVAFGDAFRMPFAPRRQAHGVRQSGKRSQEDAREVLVAMPADREGQRYAPRTAVPSRRDHRESLELTGPTGADPMNATTNVPPHQKFYCLLMSNWQPFDFYSKVTMSIGTSAMLSGVAYYSLIYMRRSAAHGEVVVHHSGWFVFAFMSVLAWWSVTLDLELSKAEHGVVAIVSLGGPLATAAIMHSSAQLPWLWLLPTILQGIWAMLLCCSGVSTTHGSGWPRHWQAARYLDVASDACSGSVDGRLGITTARPSRREQFELFAHAATLLLKLVEAILEPVDAEMPLPTSEADQVRAAHEKLRGAAKVLGRSQRTTSSTEHGDLTGIYNGFWLVLPTKVDGKPWTRWIHPDRKDCPAEPDGDACQVVTLGEMLEAVYYVVDGLRHGSASAWTPSDADRLAAYGSAPGATESIFNFESQFRSRGMAARRKKGDKARHYFNASVVVIGIAWIAAVGVCCLHCSEFQKQATSRAIASEIEVASASDAMKLRSTHRPEASSAPGRLARTRSPMTLPRPWFLPASISCSADGQRLALADGVRAYVMQPNGSQWLGPLSSCGSRSVAVAFDADERVIAAPAHGGAPETLFPHTARDTCDQSASPKARQSGPHEPLFEAIALDTVPQSLAGAVGGLAVQNGNLVVLELSQAGVWEAAGALPAPGARRWVGVSLRAGRALALDSSGDVFELDTPSGTWQGPWHLGDDFAWTGVCVLPLAGGASAWLGLGHQTAGRGSRAGVPRDVQLWRFDTKFSAVAA